MSFRIFESRWQNLLPTYSSLPSDFFSISMWPLQIKAVLLIRVLCACTINSCMKKRTFWLIKLFDKYIQCHDCKYSYAQIIYHVCGLQRSSGLSCLVCGSDCSLLLGHVLSIVVPPHTALQYGR